jgi:hypothetical protein
MLRALARQYRQTHPQKIRETAASRRRYLAERVKKIELNDDPESLLYAGNFSE